MTTESDNLHFDDPELRNALARALPNVTAPASLRLSIEQAMDVASVAHADAPPLTHFSPWRIGRWFPAHRRLAIAASIAGLGLGIGLFLASEQFPGDSGKTSLAVAEPVLVQGAMVRHDELHRSLATGDEQFRRSLYSVPQVREQLQRESRINLPQADLAPSGWELAGAKPCAMGNCCGAQIFYTRGQQTLSVFVFPPNRISPEMLAGYGEKNGHMTAMRNLPDATLLVIARCPGGKLKQDELEEIATRLAGGR